jgi:hypothetical protein
MQCENPIRCEADQGQGTSGGCSIHPQLTTQVHQDLEETQEVTHLQTIGQLLMAELQSQAAAHKSDINDLLHPSIKPYTDMRPSSLSQEANQNLQEDNERKLGATLRGKLGQIKTNIDQQWLEFKDEIIATITLGLHKEIHEETRSQIATQGT